MTLQAVDTVKLNESDLKAEWRAEGFEELQGAGPKADPFFGAAPVMKPLTACRMKFYPVWRAKPSGVSPRRRPRRQWTLHRI